MSSFIKATARTINFRGDYQSPVAIDPPFPLDIIVRTPHNLGWQLAEGASFLTEITAKGKVLYEKKHSGVGSQSRKRLPARRGHRSGKRAISR